MSETLGNTENGLSSSNLITQVKQTTPDDLLAHYLSEPKIEQKEVLAAAQKNAKIAEETEKQIVANKIAKKLDVNNVEEKKDEILQTTNEEKEGDADPQESESLTEEEIRKWAAKFGESEIEVPEEAVFSIPIGNKQATVKFADIVKNYQNQEKFNRAMQSRINTVAYKEKDLNNQLVQITDKARAISQLAAEGKIIPALKALAKLAAPKANIDIISYERQVLDGLANIYKTYSSWNDQEKNHYFAERKAEEAQKEAESLRQQNSYQSELGNLRNKVISLTKEHGITEDKFIETYKALVEVEVGEGKTYLHPNDITPEDVIEFHYDIETYGQIGEALKRINDKPDAWDQKFIHQVFDEVRNEEDFTVDDIEAVVRTALSLPRTPPPPSESVQNVNRKLQKANSTALQAQLRNTNTTKKNESALDAIAAEFANELYGRRR